MVFNVDIFAGQTVLLGLSEDEAEQAEDTLTVVDSLVPFDDLGPPKPGVEGEDCEATVTTFSSLQVKIEPSNSPI